MTALLQTLLALVVMTVDRVGGQLTSLARRETGGSAVEYALLVGAVAVAGATAVALFGPQLNTLMDHIDVHGISTTTDH